jgi:uncharacterized protein (UPF0216 family)
MSKVEKSMPEQTRALKEKLHEQGEKLNNRMGSEATPGDFIAS